MRKLLIVDPAKRLTPAAALKHVWVSGVANKSQDKGDTIEKLKEFNARRKLKVRRFLLSMKTKECIFFLENTVLNFQTIREKK